MKPKITFILTLAASLFAASVQQANAQVVEVTPTGGASIYDSVASNLAVGTFSIDCSKQQNISVQWTVQLAGAGTETHGIRFVGLVVPGTRPSNANLQDGYYMAVAANGTTPVIVTTNFNVKGFSRLDCTYMTNGTAALATNTVKYWVKRDAP